MIELKTNPDIAQLQKRLARLQKELQAKVVHSSLVYAVKPVKASMKQLLPSDTGDLRSSVGHKKLSGSRKSNLSAFTGASGRASFSFADQTAALLVGPNRKVNGLHQGFKAAILEFGTKPHEISPRARSGKKALALKGGGFASSVMHPGIKAGGFMQQALARHERQLANRFYTAMAKKLDKVAT